MLEEHCTSSSWPNLAMTQVQLVLMYTFTKKTK
jgi:hypothetical protein